MPADPSSLPAALMLRGAGRFPFNGLFELTRVQGDCWLSVAGRIAGSSAPEVTWDILVTVHEALADACAPDRLGALRTVWDRVLTLPRQALGPAQGKDLSLLLVATDPEGTSVAGVGLEMVWRWTPERVQPLVSPGHNLLAPPGIPTLPPGALTLDAPPTGPLIAAATGARSGAIGTSAETLALCGLRP